MLDNTHSFRFFNRGPSPVVRLVFFSVLSLLLMFIDTRYRYLESTRSTLSVMVAPIQALATLPGRVWNQVGDYFSAQSSLKNQNQTLQQQHLNDAAQLAQLQALQQENQQLRNLAALPIRATYTTQLAEVIYTERDLFKRKIIVNKGADANLQTGQVVMDDAGRSPASIPGYPKSRSSPKKIMSCPCKYCATVYAPSFSARATPASWCCAICL
jgi:rod shape-determining protein MreC